MKLRKNIIVSFIVLVGCIFIFNYTFNRPTAINRYIATHVYGAPANSSFTDDNFYQCVIDAYNEENKTNIAYSYLLTKEDLETITTLNCDASNMTKADKINNTKGLELLPNLLKLSLIDHNLTTIDLSSNSKLTHLNLDENLFNNIDVSNQKDLISLSLNENNLKIIDINNNLLLKYLKVANNNITSIDVSNNLNLELLSIYGNKLTNIDVTKNINLISLYLGSNNLNSINLTNNTLLEEFAIYSNKISEIDLSKNINLNFLNVSYNKLNIIDIRKNINIEELVIEENYLKEIYLNDELHQNWHVDSIIGAQYTNQTYINIGENHIIAPRDDYKFNFNSNVTIPEETTINNFINNLGLQNLQAKVFDGDIEITEGNVKNGYSLEILYEDSEKVQTSTIYVFDNNDFIDINFYKCIVDKYNAYNNTNISYTEILSEEQLNKITDLNCSGYDKETQERIVNTQGLQKLTNLINLDLSNNYINDIDVSGNTKLTYLDLDSNNITKINLRKNTELETLNLGYNFALEGIDLSNNTALKSLYLSSANIYSLDLSKNVNLENLYLFSNNLTNINLSSNIKLINLDIGYNKITNLDLSNQKDLEYLNLNNNNLIEIDLSNNLKLEQLNLYKNNLTNIDTSSLSQLYSLSIANNPLQSNIALYVNESLDLSNKNLIKLPEGEEYNIEYLSSDYDNITITDNKITAHKSGNYILNASYTHNIGYYNKDYNGIFNIYVAELTSEKYIINNEESYVYTGIDKNSKTILDNISLNYGEASIEDNVLTIRYDGKIIKTFEIKNLDFGSLNAVNKMISIDSEYEYTSFVNNITENGVTYKIFENENEITDKNINTNMFLNVYIEEKLIDTFDITDEYLTFSNELNVYNNKIYGLNFGETRSDFLKKINTSGNILLKNYKEDIIEDKGLIGTGTKVTIELSSGNIEYIVSIKGDISGDGISTVADFSKAYQYYKGRIEMEDCFIEAADVVTKDPEITMADVSKIYQFIKGRINTLD